MDFFKSTIFKVLVVGTILCISIFKSINEKKGFKSLKDKGSYVIGEIIDHRVSGYAETYYVEYLYTVNNIEYMNTVNFRFKFRDCHNTRDCIGRRFTVYYNPDDPKESYIDFDDEK